MNRLKKWLFDWWAETALVITALLCVLSFTKTVESMMTSQQGIAAILGGIALFLLKLHQDIKKRFNIFVTRSPQENLRFAMTIYEDAQDEVVATHFYTQAYPAGDIAEPLYTGQKGKVKFRRIMTMESQEKKDWAKKILEQAKVSNANVEIRAFPLAGADHANALHPTMNFLLQLDRASQRALVSFATIAGGHYKGATGLYTEDPNIVNNFRDYFESLWTASQPLRPEEL